MQDQEELEVKTRATYSIAWLYLNRRGDGIKRSIELNRDAISYCDGEREPHLEAVGRQYLASALFRAGHLEQAEEEIKRALDHYQFL